MLTFGTLTLEWPWAFALLPLPWLVWKLLPALSSTQAALYMPLLGERKIERSTHTRNRPSWMAVVLLALAWVLLLAAAAKPVRYGDAVELPATGRDLLLAVDISGSMQIEDMALGSRTVNRLVAVKAVVKEFIERRKGDRLGLVLFGTNAYLQAPLTFDLPTVAKLLQESEIGFAGEQTAIGDAIGLAIKRLADRPAESRVVVLLTDGQNTAGVTGPIPAAELAAQQQVVIHTIGIGYDKPIRTGFLGLQSFNPSAELDEATLQEVARITGGQYFRARNPAELQEIYVTIDQLEPIDQEPELFRPRQLLFYWPLAGAMALFLLLALLRYRSPAGGWQ
jgi:Ca-activated chloride channel family protein